MSNKVFANMMEVSCKAGQGKAICAMPDVCMTPPQTPATPPGVPIPYPNTGMSSDCSDGSTSVKISGQEAMLKNKSCFKKSSGDEAGSAPKKGLITSKNMGKVYFNMWSMDVMFEGENVDRHFDLTTHNHASPPGNTPPWMYTESMAPGAGGGGDDDPCKETRENAETKCKQQKDDNTYSTGRVNQSGFKKDACKDEGCAKAMECVLVPYSAGCCPGKTAHHVIPAHCFMPPGARGGNTGERYSGCEKYNDKAAPCVCVTGEDKSEKDKQHARIHAHFDAVEDEYKDKGGTWTYDQAAKTGAESVDEVVPGCNQKCTRAQLDNYHDKQAGISPETKLRADSHGKAKPSDTLIVIGDDSIT